jgi:hypothetical protein
VFHICLIMVTEVGHQYFPGSDCGEVLSVRAECDGITPNRYSVSGHECTTAGAMMLDSAEDFDRYLELLIETPTINGTPCHQPDVLALTTAQPLDSRSYGSIASLQHGDRSMDQWSMAVMETDSVVADDRDRSKGKRKQEVAQAQLKKIREKNRKASSRFRQRIKVRALAPCEWTYCVS